ncbi:hypothetical protein HDG38_006937 [Paraburkholderia sp. WSM4177]|nr:hypothetical protein [Paraburkholderia sp. WSM4177]MBB5488671.1 hypothetical protein [Paraburkholderia sp. WSM4180]
MTAALRKVTLTPSTKRYLEDRPNEAERFRVVAGEARWTAFMKGWRTYPGDGCALHGAGALRLVRSGECVKCTVYEAAEREAVGLAPLWHGSRATRRLAHAAADR